MTDTKKRTQLGVGKNIPSRFSGRIVEVEDGDEVVVVKITTENYGKGNPGFYREVLLPTLKTRAAWPMVDGPIESGLTVALAKKILDATTRFVNAVNNGTDTELECLIEEELAASLKEAGVQF